MQPIGKKIINKILKTCVAKTLPGGLKMWVSALDGEGGLGRTPKEFGDMKISVRKRLDQTKNI